jgi:hypothetical protein
VKEAIDLATSADGIYAIGDVVVAKMPMSHLARALEVGEVMSILQTAMMGNVPVDRLQSAPFAHPTLQNRSTTSSRGSTWARTASAPGPTNNSVSCRVSPMWGDALSVVDGFSTRNVGMSGRPCMSLNRPQGRFSTFRPVQ